MRGAAPKPRAVGNGYWHSEAFLTRSDAMAREYALKNDRKARQRLLAR